jgi:hypothetical protein
MELEARPRQRAPRYNSQFVRAALGVVRPINRQIGEWQSRVALLEALSMVPRGRAAPDLATKARELKETVAAEQLAFRQRVDTLPREVAAESRVADTGRALGTVITAVDRILGRLDHPS